MTINKDKEIAAMKLKLQQLTEECENQKKSNANLEQRIKDTQKDTELLREEKIKWYDKIYL